MPLVRPWFAVVLVVAAACGDPPPPPEAPDPEVAALVRDLVDGDDYGRRKEAHDRLPSFGAAIVRPLAEALDRPDVDAGVGAWIAEVLGALGPAAEPAAPALMRRLMQGGECSATTSWALGQIGEAGVPFLARAASSEHAKARLWALDAIGDVGGEHAAAAEAVLRALNDSDPEIRGAAIHALSALPASGRVRSVPALLGLTRDPAEEVRGVAASALAAIRGEDAEVQARLREMVVDPAEEPQVRATVLDALGARLGRDPAALDLLRRVADSEASDGGLRRTAREMLLARGADDADLVAEVAAYEEGEAFGPLMRRALALSEGGPNARRAALPLLVRVLDWSPEADDRVAAAVALGALGREAADSEAVRGALAAHADPAKEEASVVAAARAALERLGTR